MKRINLEIASNEVDVIQNGFIKKISKEGYHFYVCGNLYKGLTERRFNNVNDIVLPIKDGSFDFIMNVNHSLLINHHDLEIFITMREGI